MARLKWGAIEDRRFEAGVDRGGRCIEKKKSEPWNGLVSVQEAPLGRETTAYYFDGFNYLTHVSTGSFRGQLEAYSSPPSFDACDGTIAIANGFFATEQPRKPFGLSYRTKIGDASTGLERGYKIHLIYNAYASVSDKTYETLTDDPEATPLTWDISATSVRVPGIKPTAHFIIDSTVTYPEVLAAVEDILYGTDEEAARLPTAEELQAFFKTVAYLIIDDHGDGTFTATSTDDIVTQLDDDLFEITY